MFTFTDSIDALAAAFADPIEYREAASQLADCGVDMPSGASPRLLAREVVRVFGSYDVRVD